MTLQDSNNKKILLTQDGYDELLAEHKDLTENQRPAVVNDIKSARDLGDLSENGMYTAARDKQSFIEGRISEIEDLMKKVEVVDSKQNGNGEIELGAKVTLEMTKQNVEYHIVSAEEVDYEKNKISHESPLGKALIGKKVGDEVEYEAPVGVITYKIIDIK